MDSFVSSSRFRCSYASMTSIPPSPTLPTVYSGPGSGVSARQDAKKRTIKSGGPDETGMTTSFRFAREQLRTGTAAAADCQRSLSPSRPNGAPGTHPEGGGVFDSPDLIWLCERRKYQGTGHRHRPSKKTMRTPTVLLIP